MKHFLGLLTLFPLFISAAAHEPALNFDGAHTPAVNASAVKMTPFAASGRPLETGLPGGNYRITPEMIRFTYAPWEGGQWLKCRHELDDPAAQDWSVVCGDNEKIYRVHLWLKLYTRPVRPQASYELLFWVTDRTQPRRIVNVGHTTWFHMKDPASLDRISTREAVDNDTGGLYLDMVLAH